MKKYVLTIAVLLFVLICGNSYALNNFNYTGIAFDGTGDILPSQTVGVNIKIIISGTVSYEEDHTGVSTDQFGAYTVEVGSGTVVSGVLSTLTATKELRIQATITSGSGGTWVVRTLKPNVAVTGANTSPSGWDLTGNAGTTAGTNFIGTTDNVPFEMRVANSGTTENQFFIGANNEIYRENPNLSFWVAGNTRGQAAVDLQGDRDDATQVASGSHSTVGGGGSNTANGLGSTVGGGAGNIASGDAGTVGGGVVNTASGDYSTIAGGWQNTASGDYSTVGGGSYNTAQSYGETVAGLFATVGAGTADSYVAGDRLFVIGNGTGTGARSNALVMLKNGNTTLNGDLTATGNAYVSGDVGIGTTSPSQPLQVIGDAVIGGGATDYDNSDEFIEIEAQSEDWYIGVRNLSTAANSDFHIGLTQAQDGIFHIQPNGNIGIGTTSPNSKLDVNGTANFAGSATVGGNATVTGDFTANGITVGGIQTVSTASNPASITETIIQITYGTTTTYTFPAGTSGQIIYVVNTSGVSHTVGSTAIATGTGHAFVYVGAWIPIN